VGELAVASGRSPSEIYKLLNGNRKKPRIDFLEDLAASLHVSTQATFETATTGAELRSEMSRGALRVALARSGPARRRNQAWIALADSPHAPVSPEAWEAFMALSDELRDAGDERARMPHSLRARARRLPPGERG
jgi:transcriptional regulator with XRE-family HTH domain